MRSTPSPRRAEPSARTGVTGGLRLAAGLLFVVVATTAAATPVERAVTAAREAGLDRRAGWRTLLHNQGSESNPRSPIDDPRFFLAPCGKDDPAAELEATVRALYTEPAPGEEAAACRFPARRAWLAEQLEPAGIDLPKVDCDELEKALERVDPHAAALVFPVGHMNDPASMFGHTLLRIDSTHASALLSHAVNYAARIDPADNGILYAIKGIFGGYGGNYALLPYYQMVQTYAHMDQRDMWEYPLDLTEAEVHRLFLHIWELREATSDYYFFDENCASNLLFLLEAARPTLTLTRFAGEGEGAQGFPRAPSENTANTRIL